jgi:hypothetical protein
MDKGNKAYGHKEISLMDMGNKAYGHRIRLMDIEN